MAKLRMGALYHRGTHDRHRGHYLNGGPPTIPPITQKQARGADGAFRPSSIVALGTKKPPL